MSHADPLRELHELIVAQLTDELTPSQHARLETLLDTDDLLRREYVEAMHDAAVLNHVLHVTQVGETKLAVAFRYIKRPTPFSMTVAALVMLLIISVMAMIAAPIYQQWAQRIDLAPIRNDAVFVAELTDVYDDVWAEGQLSNHRGAHLVVGHRLELESGRAEVTFRSGAVVIVAGPAIVEIEGEKQLRLQTGKLVATVPPAAVGFEVATPTVNIVDLGTEFGVDVAKDKSGEIHVLQGRVEVSRAGAASDAEKITLNAGQAWQFQAGGRRGQAAKSDPQRFAIALPKPQEAIFQAGAPDPITGEVFDGVEDVMLIAWGSDKNFGARTDFDVGQNSVNSAHTLLRFDLSSLAGRVDRLMSVTLRVTPRTEASYFPWLDTGEISLYSVSDANASWQEGTHIGGGNSGAAEGESTWDRRNHPAESWSGSNGASTVGVDHQANALAPVPYATHTNYPLDFRIRGDLQFIQDWIDGKTNAGFILRETTGTADNRINFHSSESENSSARPRLIVRYLSRDTREASVSSSNEFEAISP